MSTNHTNTHHMETSTAIQLPTDQEIFNKVCGHLAQQKGPSMRVTSHSGGRPTQCAYRGEGCRSCAVGFLIPDEHYRPIMEGCNVQHVVSLNPVLGQYTGLNMILLRSLQQAHDEATLGDDGEDMRKRLLHIAQYHDLDARAVAAITEWNEYQPVTA